MSHHEIWYIRRLQKYFNEHYLQYDETVEWYATLEINKWRFKINELYLEIILVCDDNGVITEFRKTLT